MLARIFCKPKPIIGMVHLQYLGSVEKVVKEALSDAERLERGGADGLIIENWGGDYSDRFAANGDREYLTAALKAVAKKTKLPFGVNVLPLDYEKDFEIAAETGAAFVQIDTFVDAVNTDYANRFTIRVKPQDIIAYRIKVGLEENVDLFVNIQTKHYKTLPSTKRIETSARQSVALGADALVVTGEITGEAPQVEKLQRVKKVAGNIPVGSGSGLNTGNARELFANGDFFIVGTGIKVDMVTENPVDEARVRELIEIVQSFR